MGLLIICHFFHYQAHTSRKGATRGQYTQEQRRKMSKKERIEELIAKLQQNPSDFEAATELERILEEFEYDESDEDEETLHRVTTVVTPSREYPQKCGYCKGEGGSVSFGMSARMMSVEDYQSLIDRGWRRSGSWLYKPNNAKSCCPAYTIRLDVHKFVASKGHHKVKNRMNKFLSSGQLPKGNKINEENEASHSVEETLDVSEGKEEKKNEEAKNAEMNRLKSLLEESVKRLNVSNNVELKNALNSCGKGDEWVEKVRVTPSSTNKIGSFSSNLAQVLEGMTRRKHKEEDEFPVVSSLSIAKFISDDLNTNGVKNETERGYINFAGEKIQKSKLKNEPQKKRRKAENVDKKMDLNLTMSASSFTEEEFELYKKYQTSVHNDKPEKVTPEAYKRFLVESPLVAEGIYGSFHQQYRIDGKLVAVGVVDVLPKCLSSVYFFYDPDFTALDLGVYSALNEIDWVKDKCKEVEGLHYYYLGFYIHQCKKMRYKAQYKPSDLLCPLNYTWVPLAEVTPKLDQHKYFQFSEGEVVSIPEARVERIRDEIPIKIQSGIYQYKQLTSVGKQMLGEHLAEYVRLVGEKLASSILCEFS
eukprot:TRINITY_DN3244_c0_g1_i1.p1 TRINITY_DN3244_c0_g1~~TRINITY_DN3244_c0_g1_i1.p1  ORF type:complete len:589 (-),score=181.91 TRINITY_DN3244_c0_g1_i1:287-2053(-)